ncbi:MAG: TrkA family potassium uptake protein [Anaerolineae bacterium]|nr:TrkA family potassium uptake protein [Anaerolineae bacterium]
MHSTLPESYRRRHLVRRWRYLKAIGINISTLLVEFRRPLLAFVLVTIGGGFIYGEWHEQAGLGSIPLIDRPYIMLQLMTLNAPSDAPPQAHLMLFWYALPPVFIFIVGNGVVDFVQVFFDRSGRQQAWRRALVSTYRNHVIVFGAGHVGLRVARLLHHENIELVVIDNDPEPGVQQALDEMRIQRIPGDGTVAATLLEAGVKEAEAFVACTGSDQANLLAIMQVRDMRPNIRIVARVWEEWYAQKMTALLGVDAVLSASDLVAPAFAGHTLGAEISQTMHVGDEEYSTLRVTVNAGSFMDGLTVGDLQRQHDMDIVLHCHNGRVDIQPAHDLRVTAGDTVVIFARHRRAMEIANRNRYRR